jgi:predicted permease
MTILLTVVVPVILIVSVSAFAHFRLKFDVRTLSRVAFYLFTPALVFDSLTNSDVSAAEFGQIAAVILLTTLAILVLGTFTSRLLGLGRPTEAAFLTCLVVMNAGNYGLSVNLFAYGQPGLARASVSYILTAMIASTFGVYLSARGRASGGLALRRVFSVPMIYAAVLGLAFNLGHWTVPETFARAIHLLGQAAVPGMLVVLGVRLAETFRAKERVLHVPALAAVSAGRLLIAPALAWLFSGLIGLQDLARDVTVVECAMPTAVMATILATEFDSDPPFAALCILVTTLLSIPSLTLLLNLLA